MKLTGTNSSIGLIILITYAHSPMANGSWKVLTDERGESRYPPDVAPKSRRRPIRPCGPDGPEGCGLTSRKDGYIPAPASQPLNMRFADLVVIAEWLHPIPFRTRS